MGVAAAIRIFDVPADRSVRYEAVLNVMDELQKQQIAKIGLLVQAGK